MVREHPNEPFARYADDGVAHCRTKEEAEQLRDSLQTRMVECRLELNLAKTRIVYCKDDDRPGDYPDIKFDFLGYTFRQDRDQYGRPQRYWNLLPSRKAVARERDALRGAINCHQSHTPLPEMIGRVNRQMRGWANYFGLGYPRNTFRALNHFVRYRLSMHLRRRSQRGWRPRAGVSLYAHLDHLGLVSL